MSKSRIGLRVRYSAILRFVLLFVFLGVLLPIITKSAIPILFVLMLLIVVLVVNRMRTFRLRNFINVAKRMGFQCKRKKYIYALSDFFSIYNFTDGFLDDIYVVAKLDVPIIEESAYQGIFRKRRDNENVKHFDAPSTINDLNRVKHIRHLRKNVNIEKWEQLEESQVELFSLISGAENINININILINNENCEISRSGDQAIDAILEKSLTGTNDFHAKITFDKNCLRMAIIGGSWLGKRFEQRILKGFEIFKKLNEELRSKYTVNSWDDWEVKWNRKEEEFLLGKKSNPIVV